MYRLVENVAFTTLTNTYWLKWAFRDTNGRTNPSPLCDINTNKYQLNFLKIQTKTNKAT